VANGLDKGKAPGHRRSLAILRPSHAGRSATLRAAADEASNANLSIDAVLRRELYFFTLYRAFQAALLAFAAFSPFAAPLVELDHPATAKGAAAFYMGAALLLLFLMRGTRMSIAALAGTGLVVDIAIALLARHVITGLDGVFALLLMVNIGAGALLLPLRSAAALSLAASMGIVGEFVISTIKRGGDQRDAVEAIMFAITYLAVAALAHLLGRQLRQSTALAERRGVEVANLSHLNELIIRRMRTGVLVVDAGNQVRLMNEAAWHLLGGPRADLHALRDICPELAQRLARWRIDRVQDAEPVALAPDRPPVVPRIATLTVIDELFMIFLDDGRLVSRRAEELTLATLGRLSAGIAHEVRNPLAAIKHAAQLLEESTALPAEDRRLIEIVLAHCNRMNGIVENVLQLARQERSRPEHVDIASWTEHFVLEFQRSHFINGHSLDAIHPTTPVIAMVDPNQLHQVLSALVQNSIAYGHALGEPARITLRVEPGDRHRGPALEVSDRGPGIPTDVVEHIFDPFFTTSELGNGLGLYIARQLCEANQALLEYVAPADGGSCFRISLARPLPLSAGRADDTAAADRL